MNLLLVDDDAELGQLMAEYLRDFGVQVDAALDGTQGLARALSGTYDLVLLDGMLPGLDGLEVLRQLRRRSNVPVIMLTARGAPRDRIAGLDTGADDYLTKPFGPAELLAHVRAVLRRTQTAAGIKSEVIELGGLVLNTSEREAYLAGEPCAITSIQFQVLDLMMRNPNRAVSRDELTGILHQREATPFERWLDVHISQLRKKIERDGVTRIQTIRGVGYMFVVNA
jgi:two-component system response regulator CpxR